MMDKISGQIGVQAAGGSKIDLLLGLEVFVCSFDTAIQVHVYFTSALENLVLKGYI